VFPKLMESRAPARPTRAFATLRLQKNYNNASMISQDLLDILVCPVCKQPVALSPDGKALKCSVCRRVYPIQDDIPIMLIDAAKIDAA